MKVKKRAVGAVGRIEEYAAATPPRNTIKANGAELSRALFWRLFKHAQESGNLVDQASKDRGQYGTGDGVNTFTIPNLRGEFLRAFDDGAGVDTGRVLGSWQVDEFKSHNHAQSRRQASNAGGGSYGRAHSSLETVSTGSTGGNETRPRNIAILYCIRYQ
jgi:phage-related tail fiber protein